MPDASPPEGRVEDLLRLYGEEWDYGRVAIRMGISVLYARKIGVQAIAAMNARNIAHAAALFKAQIERVTG